MTKAYKSRVAGGLCLAGVTGLAAAAVALLGPPASAAVRGGDSNGVSSANGGNGSETSVSETPLAQSGSSGNVNAQSTATNTGNTGPASSTAISNPVAVSGNSGTSGRSGGVTSTQTQSALRANTSNVTVQSNGLSSSTATQVANATSRGPAKAAQAVASIDDSSAVTNSTGTTSSASESSLVADSAPAPAPAAPLAPSPDSAVDLAVLGLGVATNNSATVAGSEVRNGGPTSDVPSA